MAYYSSAGIRPTYKLNLLLNVLFLWGFNLFIIFPHHLLFKYIIFLLNNLQCTFGRFFWHSWTEINHRDRCSNVCYWKTCCRRRCLRLNNCNYNTQRSLQLSNWSNYRRELTGDLSFCLFKFSTMNAMCFLYRENKKRARSIVALILKWLKFV